VLATVVINLFTCLALLLVLQQRISGLPLRRWGMDLLRLAIAGVLAAGGAGILVTVVPWPSGHVGLLLQVSAPGLLGLVLFALIGAQLKVPEVREIAQLVVGRFRAR
jgi:putative peptidoglycan lipid II flippase